MRHRLVFLCIAALWVAPSGAPARQASAAQPDAAQQEAPAPITLGELEALWSLAQATGDEEIVEQARGLYEQARALIEQARALEAEGAAFEKERSEAPALLASIQQELEQAPVERPLGLPESPTVDQAQQAVAQAQAELGAAQQHQRDLEAEQRRRSERRDAIPAELAQARQSLSELAEQPAVADNGEAPETTALRRALRAAQRRLLDAQVRRLEHELASYEARRELLPARRDRAARRVAELERFVGRLQDELASIRRQEAERSEREAQRAVREAAGASEVIRRIAAENAALAALRTGEEGAPAKITGVQAQRDEARAQLERLGRNYLRVRELIADVGLTNNVGLTLRTFQSDLPNLGALNRAIGARQGVLEDVIYRLYDLEQQRRDLASVDVAVAAAVEAYRDERPNASGEEVDAAGASARRLYQDRVNLLNEAIRDYGAYRETLLALDSAQRRLSSAAGAFSDYIAERVLWIASAKPASAQDLAGAAERLRWTFDPGVLLRAGRAVATDAQRRPIRPALALAAVAGVILLRTRAGSALGEKRRREPGPLRAALEGAALAMLGAAPWPAVMLAISWLLRGASQAPDAPAVRMEVLAESLRQAAILLFLLRFMSVICRPGGFAVKRLNWREAVAASIRVRLRWYTPLAVAVAIVSVSAPVDVGDAGVNAPDPVALRRLSIVAFQGLTALALWRIFRPKGPVMAQVRLASRGGWMSRLRYLWLTVLVGAPVTIAILALSGFVFTGAELGRRLIGTMWALAGVIVLQSALMQWLVTARRRLELEQARRRREAAEVEEGPALGADGAARPPEETDLAALDIQTRRLFRTGVVIATTVLLWIIWADASPALRMLERVELYPNFGAVASAEEVTPRDADGILELSGVGARTQAVAPTQAQPGAPDAQAPTGAPAQGQPALGPAGAILSPGDQGAGAPPPPTDAGRRITLGRALLAALLGVIALAASRNLPGLLEITLLQRLDLDSGLRNAVTALVRYTIAIVGVIVAFSVAGLGWSKVQWLAAALTFGLAFGLQEIFANFVSGLIILLERPIRIGDTVTVGNVSGEVSKIRFRATTITDWDRKELVVPNKEFITGRLVNWTLSDPVLRVVVPVGVAYGSDVQKATDIMLRIARANPHVLDDPPALALFLGFGDSALQMELRVLISSINHFVEVRDTLHRRIDAEFRKAGIEISFPQRDLHLRSISPEAGAALADGLARAAERAPQPAPGLADERH